MKPEIRQTVFDAVRWTPPLTPWEWACASVDWSLAADYESAARGRFDPAYQPYMREPMDATADPDCREIVFLKCSRAGGSENLLLMPIRYAVAVNPQPIIYASSQQETTEDFYQERILGGMKCSRPTAAALAQSRQRGNIVYFGNGCHIVATWSKSISGFKQRGAGLALADEVSSWPDVGRLDMLRKRMDTFSFPHLVIVSSPDPSARRPSDEDPIFMEFEDSDQRYWYMPDPAGGEPFRFEMGTPESVAGLKWDKDARREEGWDLNRVAETAHYVTPGGAVIGNDRRRAVIATGAWVAMNRKAARKGKRGYHLNQFYVPFASGDFGHIAVRFLESKHKGLESLRVFIYEVLAEKWKDKVDMVHDDEIYKRAAEYERGKPFSDAPELAEQYKGKRVIYFLTMDVQKSCVWWLVTCWAEGGACGIVDYGAAAAWQDVEKIANLYKVFRVYVDNSYEVRQTEVYEECFLKKMIPTFGRTNISLPFVRRVVDPFEGKTRGGRYAMPAITWNPDIFKMLAHDMLRGNSVCKFYLYKHAERELIRQLVSEELVGGVWKPRRGYPQNHLWDCLCIALLAATIDGLHRVQ